MDTEAGSPLCPLFTHITLYQANGGVMPIISRADKIMISLHLQTIHYSSERVDSGSRQPQSMVKT